MTDRNLGLLGVAGAPFLFIDTLTGGLNPYQHTHLTGFFGFVYMAGWMCSLFVLKRLGAFGENKAGKWVFQIQMLLLILAQGWNILALIQPGAGTMLYNILDLFWPLSNVFMLATGTTILLAQKLEGWQRFSPLLVGLWLPLGALYWVLIGRTTTMLVFAGVYSTAAWTLMGLSACRYAHQKATSYKNAHGKEQNTVSTV